MTDSNNSLAPPKAESVETFLAGRRLGALTTASFPASFPAPRPVWFDWDGQTAHMFSSSTAPKIRRLAKNPSATLLVSNEVDEPEFWVAIQGDVEVEPENVIDTVERLALRYWGDQPTKPKQDVLEYWRAKSSSLTNLRLHMHKLSSGGG